MIHCQHNGALLLEASLSKNYPHRHLHLSNLNGIPNQQFCG